VKRTKKKQAESAKPFVSNRLGPAELPNTAVVFDESMNGLSVIVHTGPGCFMVRIYRCQNVKVHRQLAAAVQHAREGAQKEAITAQVSRHLSRAGL
jgi:hypothetical protein